MKHIILIICTAMSLCSCGKDDPQSKTGNIYGVVTDKATGEPIRAAGVQVNPTGTKTVTGDAGQYEFRELPEGSYTIQVTKTGYSDLLNYKIAVATGKTNKGDVQLEKLPPSLRVVNDNKQDIASLEFGSAAADLTRSFNIFNDGPESLEWEITKTSDWITNISKTSGSLKTGATQAIIVTIDRGKLANGENTTTIHVTSDNGSKQLTVTANKILPTLSTLDVTDITTTTAVFNGKIMSAGIPSYTERGFVYSTSSMPNIENSIKKLTAAVNSVDSFSSTATGLTLNQTYYVRAYASNSSGTAYSSNEVSFKTIMSMPVVTTEAVTSKNMGTGTATFNGTVVSAGDPNYTERGFAYGLVHNPTVDDDTKRVVSGIGTGVFSANLTGLVVGKTYYIRAYAKNQQGTAYGAEVVCDFNAVMPVVSTQDVTGKNIGAGTATVNGTVVSAGDPNYTERGFAYGLVHNPTVDDDTKRIVSGIGTGVFSANLTGLATGKTYYIRAYAKNQQGTVYGTEVVCDFNAVMPVVSTQDVTNIDATTATFNGNIQIAGDPTYTERGFAYGTMHNPTVNNTKRVVSGSGTGVFRVEITGLTTGTTYYVRAYAISSSGTVYGTEVSFTPSIPEFVVLSVAGIAVQKRDINDSNIELTTANNWCQNFIVSGYKDWRLPTISELATIYKNKDIIGNFKSSSYWSSTFFYDSYYYSINFSNGVQEFNSYNKRARCVRTITQ